MATVEATFDTLVLERTHDLSAEATFDYYIGRPTVKASFDTMVKARDVSVGATFDTHISARVVASIDYYVSEARGTYRGIMSLAERDELEALVPNDTVHVVRDDQPTQTEMWTGENWIAGDKVNAPEAGEKRSFIAPTLDGFFAEMGDSEIPFHYGDGITDRFSVSADGEVWANKFNFGQGSLLNQTDSIILRETIPYATPLKIQENVGTALASTSKSQAWGTATVAGHLLVFNVNCNSSTATVTSAPSGYTLGPTSISDGYATRLYYKPNCGAAEATPSITFSAAVDIAVITSEHSGIATSSPLDISSSKAKASPSIAYVATDPVITTVPTTLLIGAIGRQGIQDGSSNAPGWDISANPTDGAAGLIMGNAVAITPTEIFFKSDLPGATASVEYRAVAAAFKAALIGIPTPDTDTIAIFAEDVAGETKLKYENSAGHILLLDHGARTDGITSPPLLVQNTTVQTRAFTYDMPGNTAQVGDIVTIELWGTTDNKASSGTLAFLMGVMGASLSQTIASEASVHTLKPWKIRVVHQIIAVGSSGDVVSIVEWTSYMAAATTTNVRDNMFVFESGLDFTVDQRSLYLDIKWQSAAAGNIFRLYGATIHVARRGY